MFRTLTFAWSRCVIRAKDNSLLLQHFCYSTPPSCRLMSGASDADHEDFFRYTGGRWLWNESMQLRNRYKRFDVAELQRIAARSVGSRTCSCMIKLAEGGSNKVFRLTMDDGTTAIARIPHPNMGPPFKTTASEVATMDFVRLLMV
ncbi:phosphotransferase enzyme family protein [Histoplasma capsulatum var. duboisii H88]|uniref:Altered inheritance of mitochondria protein 9, mitochondrial n=1 Tax=Ajellomyces capsulatus (strain H88) TaxID=544711 RepID=F0UQH2_AJEC8|nr:phosphotransferase enzyme family protein [Histoplasma capsulatum var. duboisii H88]